MPERLFRNTPHERLATERRPAVARAEQRAAVVPEGSVEDVAALDIRVRANERADTLDGLAARGGRLVRAGIRQRENVLHDELLTGTRAVADNVLLIGAANLQAAADVARELMAKRRANRRVDRFLAPVRDARVS